MAAVFPIYTELVDPSEQLLRKKIGWICHTVRLMAVVYLLWQLVSMLQFWTNERWVIARFKTLVHIDISGISAMQRVGGFAAEMIFWLFLLGAIINIWRMFGGFLKGSIFTVAASRYLMATGLFIAASTIEGIVQMPLFLAIVTAHLPGGAHFPLGRYIGPEDLLELTFCGLLVALAHIFKTAAEIAEDRQGFI